MKRIKVIKEMLVFAFAILGIIVSSEVVSAANKDMYVGAYVGGKLYQYNDGYNTLKDVSGISYDRENCVLTLNNFNGDLIDVFARDAEIKELTVKVLGNNTLHFTDDNADYLEDDIHSVFNVTPFKDSEGTHKINVKFVGDGTLNIGTDVWDIYPHRAFGFYWYVDTFTVDGPTINSIGDHCRDEFIWADKFIMKSGNIQIKMKPSAWTSGSEKYTLRYDNAIQANEIQVLGGKITANYEPLKPDDYAYGSPYDKKDKVVAFRSDKAEMIVDGGTVDVIVGSDELKDLVIKENDNDILLRVGYYDKTRPDLWDTEEIKDVDGITWDKDKKLLTLDGYKGSDLWIATRYYNSSITICVKNYNELYDIYTEDVNVTFIGDGTLATSELCEHTHHWKDTHISKNSNHKAKYVFDGPNIKVGFLWADTIELNKGMLEVQCQSYFMEVKAKDIKFNGGRVILTIEENNINSSEPLVGVLKDVGTFSIENCIVIIKDFEGKLDKLDALFGYIDEKGTELEGLSLEPELKENAYIFIGTDEAGYPAININNYQANLEYKSTVFNGKACEPKVSVKGLIEGTDYLVFYRNNTKAGKAQAVITGIGFFAGTITLDFDILQNNVSEQKQEQTASEKKSAANASKSSDDSTYEGVKNVIKDKQFIYRIIKNPASKSKYGTVEIIGAVNNSVKKIKIASVVKIDGKKYKVVLIGKKAFANCKKLKKVIIKSTSIKKIGKKAFAGNKIITVKVPKEKKKAYKKLLKKAKINKFKIK